MGTLQGKLLLPADAMLVFILLLASAVAHGAGADKKEKLLLLVNKQSLTQTNVIYVTTTTPYTCLSAPVSTTACTGRRKRRALSSGLADVDEQAKDSGLDSSLTEEQPKSVEPQKERFRAFTVYSQVSVYTTLTSVVTDTGTTVQIKYACSAAGVSYPSNYCR